MTETQDQTPQPALIAGKYRLGPSIGKGGMGEVFAAVNVETREDVAIKQLHEKYLANSTVVKRFWQEAELVSEMDHENICPVYEAGRAADGTPYLVMPLLHGVALSKMISARESLTVSQVVDIVRQVLGALEVAHNSDVIHRDIKPSNVFVTRDGDRVGVKLLDFGISKVIGIPKASELTTNTGAVLGTPHYMAPEQARGSKTLDPRSDIFSVGVILYEALTGRKPYTGDSYNEVICKLISEPFRAPSEYIPEISRSIETVVIKAMARHPEDRYQSAGQMRQSLEVALHATENDDNSLLDLNTARMDTPDTQTSSVFKSTGSSRRPWLIGIGVALFLLLGGLITWQQANIPPLENEAAKDYSPPVDPPTVPLITTTGRPPAAENTPAVVPEEKVKPVDTASAPKGTEAPQTTPARPAAREPRQRPRTSRPRPAAVGDDNSEPDKSVKGRFGTKVVSDF